MQTVKISLDGLPSLEPAVRGPALTQALLLPRTRKLYDLVLTVPDADEHEAWVHDVRVATRRYAEAVEMARPLLPPRDVERAIRRSRKIRRRLGLARELDVVFQDFSNLGRQLDLPAYTLSRVQSAVDRRRSEAARHADDSLSPKKLLKQQGQAVAMTERNQMPLLPWRDLAADHLARRADGAENLLDSLHDPEREADHHRLRIRFKRLRYAVEMAEDLIRVEVEPKEILSTAKRVQDSLGVLNDGRDLLAFIREGEVAEILGRFREPLADEAMRIIRRRYLTARHIVLERGAGIVGLVRRTAGLIGRFQPTV